MPRFEIPIPPTGLVKNVLDIDDAGNVTQKQGFWTKKFTLSGIKSIKVKQYGITAQEMMTIFADIKGKVKKIYVLADADNKEYQGLKALLKEKCRSAFDATVEEGVKEYNLYHMDILFPKYIWLITFLIISIVLIIVAIVGCIAAEGEIIAGIIVGGIGLVWAVLSIVWYMKSHYVKISPDGIMVKKMFSGLYSSWGDVDKITDQKAKVVTYNYGVPSEIKSFNFYLLTKSGKKTSFRLPYFKGKDFVAYLQKRNIGQEK